MIEAYKFIFYILIIFSFLWNALSPHEDITHVAPDLYCAGRPLAINYCLNVQYPGAALLLMIFLYFLSNVCCQDRKNSKNEREFCLSKQEEMQH